MSNIKLACFLWLTVNYYYHYYHHYYYCKQIVQTISVSSCLADVQSTQRVCSLAPVQLPQNPVECIAANEHMIQAGR